MRLPIVVIVRSKKKYMPRSCILWIASAHSWTVPQCGSTWEGRASRESAVAGDGQDEAEHALK